MRQTELENKIADHERRLKALEQYLLNKLTMKKASEEMHKLFGPPKAIVKMETDQTTIHKKLPKSIGLKESYDYEKPKTPPPQGERLPKGPLQGVMKPKTNTGTTKGVVMKKKVKK